MRHPRDMGVADVEAFLSRMANERKVSASTHNQALSVLLFLYREVLNIDLPWLNNIGRPQKVQRIPSVLTKDEIAGPIGADGWHYGPFGPPAVWHGHALDGGDAPECERCGI